MLRALPLLLQSCAATFHMIFVCSCQRQDNTSPSPAGKWAHGKRSQRQDGHRGFSPRSLLAGHLSFPPRRHPLPPRVRCPSIGPSRLTGDLPSLGPHSGRGQSFHLRGFIGLSSCPPAFIPGAEPPGILTVSQGRPRRKPFPGREILAGGERAHYY